MNANEYQILAGRTLIDAPEQPFTDEELAIMLAAIEIGAIAGRAMDYVKKSICHRHGYKHHELTEILVDLCASITDLVNIDIASETPRHDFSDAEQMTLWSALGLGGEAGEVLENVLSVDPRELGDVSWYIAALCTTNNLSLEEVFIQNIEKLKKRYGAEGYTSAQSLLRVDTLQD